MEGAALSTSEFKEFAKDVILFAHITSKVEGDAYQDLMREKGGRGFPHLAILDANGDVVAKPDSRDVPGFVAAVADGKQFLALRSKENPTVEDRIELLGLEIKLGNYDLAKAREAAGEIEGMTDAQKAKVEDAIFPLEVMAVVPQTRQPTPEQKVAAGKAFAEMFRAGREPTDQGLMQPFFIFMLDYAEAEKDVELFRSALGKLEAAFGDNPRAKGFFDAQKARLAKLEAGGEGD
jgi:hypothetical protein